MTAFNAPAADKLGGLADGVTSPGSVLPFAASSFASPGVSGAAPNGSGTSSVPAPLSLPVMQFATSDGFYVLPSGVQYLRSGTWYDTGVRQPFDFGPLIHAPAFPILRFIAGASCHLMIIMALLKFFFPKAHY